MFRFGLIIGGFVSVSGCSMPGKYVDEYQQRWTFTMSGRALKMVADDGRIEMCEIKDDHTIHDVNDGSIGTYQGNCNVINWSTGGTWTRIGSQFAVELAPSELAPSELVPSDEHTVDGFDSQSGCSMPGKYIDEYQHHWTFTMSGRALKMVADDGRVEMCEIKDDHTIHDVNDGSTGTFQGNCNVINWSTGGTWTRIGSTSQLAIEPAQSNEHIVEGYDSESGCSMPGNYIDEYQHHWTFTMSGRALKMVADDGRVEMCEIKDDHTIHDVNDGSIGTYQGNCNVINWSTGGTWTRISGELLV